MLTAQRAAAILAARSPMEPFGRFTPHEENGVDCRLAFRNSPEIWCGPCLGRHILENMPRDWQQDVYHFGTKFGKRLADQPQKVPATVLPMCHNVLREELAEVLDALINGTPADVADGVADLIYFLLDVTNHHGIDLRPVWTAVHEANMRKVGGFKREDGKIEKPPGWVHPDIAAVLACQRPLPEAFEAHPPEDLPAAADAPEGNVVAGKGVSGAEG